jgi:hypothetical protein
MVALRIDDAEEDVRAYRSDVAEAFGLAFYYCARQVERVRLTRERGSSLEDFAAIGTSFSAMLALLRTDPDKADDREGVLHMMLEDFLGQLLLLAPDPNALT